MEKGRERIYRDKQKIHGLVCDLYIPAQKQLGTLEKYLNKTHSSSCNRKYKLKWFKQ